MKIRLALSLSITRAKPDEDVTIDLVGIHRDIPKASYDVGFRPEEDRGNR